MPGGVLQRAGQTEGSVDLARLAGLTPAGVICEIMKPDGTMARMPDLREFAKEHDLTIVSIADMVEYRLQRDRLIEKVNQFDVEVVGNQSRATFTAHLYRASPGIRRREYVALVLGDIDDGEPVPCRGHVGSLVTDVFGCPTRGNRPSVREVIDVIVRRGRGVLLYLPSRETINDDFLTHVDFDKKVRSRDKEGEIREYGIGAQILLDLGVKRLQVISNNPHRLVGLEAWGFESADQVTMEEV